MSDEEDAWSKSEPPPLWPSPLPQEWVDVISSKTASSIEGLQLSDPAVSVGSAPQHISLEEASTFMSKWHSAAKVLMQEATQGT